MKTFKEYFLAENKPLNVYHGTPNYIEGRFSLSKIGTGEGAQVYGWGLYFAENKEVASHYQYPKIGIDNIWVGEYKLADHPLVTQMFDGQTYESINYKIRQGRASRFNAVDVEAHDFIRELVTEIKKYFNNSRKTEIPNHVFIDLTMTVEGSLKGSKRYYDEDPSRFDFENKRHYEMLQTFYKLLTTDEDIRINVTPGGVYKVRLLVTPSELLDFDESLDSNPEQFNMLRRIPLIKKKVFIQPKLTGDDFYGELKYGLNINPKQASLFLNSIGIKGIRYKDQGSRGKNNAVSYNYVIFDDRNIKRVKETEKDIKI